jgi:hypothetical protein
MNQHLPFPTQLECRKWETDTSKGAREQREYGNFGRVLEI